MPDHRDGSSKVERFAQVNVSPNLAKTPRNPDQDGWIVINYAAAPVYVDSFVNREVELIDLNIPNPTIAFLHNPIQIQSSP
jgi:hypothetical protein